MKAPFFDRVRRHSRSLFKQFKIDRHFSYRLAVYRAINHISGGVFGNYSLLNKSKDKELLKLIGEIEKPVIEKYYKRYDLGEYVENAPVFVCWWDGIDSAPILVKRCIRSIRENSNGHPVHFIDKYNYHEYVEIPTFILKKAEMGIMGLANLADYLRVSLIAKYGGIWIDATILAVKQIPDTYFKFPVFSIKDQRNEDSLYIAQSRWSTFFIGGMKGNVFFEFLKEAFEEYWSKNDKLIEYMLFDYLIEISYRTNKEIRRMIDTIPVNNTHCFALRDGLIIEAPVSEMSNYIFEDTIFYKLSWKSHFGMKASNGEDSIYASIINS